jgi:PII-like signaling protein
MSPLRNATEGVPYRRKSMKLEGEQVLLRVHLRNTDKHGWGSAADALLERARAEGLAGATILRGLLGLHFTGELLESKIWSLVDHAPVIVELVDNLHDIGSFLTTVDQMIPEGLATLERAHVLVYRHSEKTAAGIRQHMEIPGRIADLSTLPSAEEFPIMKLSHDGQMLRIFIGESDERQGTPLYRAIVLEAKRLGLAGATVLRGSMGYGANSRIHAAKLLDISTDLPIVIEIVDEADKINTLLPFLDESVQEGLITIEAVRVLKYLANRGQESPE